MVRTRLFRFALAASLLAALTVLPAVAKDRTITIDVGDPNEGGVSLSLSGSWLAKELLADVAAEIDCDDDADREIRQALLYLRKRGEGARVTVTAGDLKQIREICPVTGYLSQADPRAHFGLGAARQADVVEIRWPDGSTQQLENVAANQLLTVVQDAK